MTALFLLGAQRLFGTEEYQKNIRKYVYHQKRQSVVLFEGFVFIHYPWIDHIITASTTVYLYCTI